MATITVKNIPPELYEKLKRRAKENHRSLNREIIYCIEQVVLSQIQTPEEFAARAHLLRELTAPYQLSDEELKQAKEAGRP